jgi:hypothetical protein
MNKIDLHNYEAYYLDYLEGNLSKDFEADLLKFLDVHPHLIIEDSELPSLTASQMIEYTDKSSLKSLGLAEELIIGELEGVNTTLQIKALNQMYGKNPYLYNLKSQYAKTILPNTEIKYRNKEELKKEVLWLKSALTLVSIAAMVVMIFLSIEFFKDTGSELNRSMVRMSDWSDRSSGYDESILNIDNNALPSNRQQIVNIKQHDKGEINTFKTIVEPLVQEVSFDFNYQSDFKGGEISMENSIQNAFELEMPINSIQATENIDLAVNKEINNKEYTFGQLIGYQIRKIVVKDVEPSFEKIESNEVLSLVTSGINSISKTDVTLAQESMDNKEITMISFGKIEFYRSKSK